MTFSVNGIKQENNEKFPLEMLVCVDAPLLARKILEQTSILILSLKEFSWDKKTFGDIYFIIKNNFQEIEIVTKYEDIQAACTFFIGIGFAIHSINRYSKPLAEPEISAIIEQSQKEEEQKKILIQEQIQKNEEQEKKVYEDTDLASAKKIIVRVFEKIEETTKRSEGNIDIQDLKKIKSLSDDLKKLRMGTNFEKISETIQEISKILEKINTEYYSRIQNPNETIFPDSLVTPIDVEKEVEKMENVKMLKELGAKISLKNQDYATFGSFAMYWKFLQKDVLSKWSNISWVVYNLFDIAELILVLVIASLGIYTLANEIYVFSLNQYGLSFSLISIGTRGVLLFIGRYIRNKTLGRWVMLIAAIVLLHYFILWMVTTNFAL